ncbi:hypothetical protein CAEBREN_07971 [Caenorhabditis brenneri]|uniref:Peptidase M13 C-terminal domain-containing protein n=1 Tax=Caenorhabditis brenneri TaxID=135651 RepID=G0NQH4_CAEBE|nr:hypothetical protein CAEBREN_07971 [Caenorhabditis brenneri]
MEIKNKLRNPLIAVILILLIAIIAILATVGIWKFRSKPVERVIVQKEYLKSEQESRNVCESPECITLAHQLLNWRDKNVDPCDNFYRASCGNYIEHNMVDGTRNTKKGKVVKRLIKEFLVQNHTSESKSEYTMKLLYQKCEALRNQTIFEHTHEHTMKEVLNDILSLGPWPMIEENWKASKFDLNAMLSNMAKLGHLDFGLFEVQLLHGKVVGVNVNYESVHNGEHKMHEIISAILTANNITFNSTKIDRSITEVYEFYEELKKNGTGFDKLRQFAPNIQFEKILKNLIHPETGDWTKLKSKIEHGDKVFNRFKGNKEVRNETLARILSNWLVLKFIENSYSTISWKASVAHDRACDDVVFHTLPRATLRAFVRNHFDRKNLKIVSEMLEETRKTYLEIIANTTWLSEEGKRRASLKMSTMKKLIGYPEEYDEEGKLDSTFGTLHVTESDSLYTIMKKIKRYRTELLMDFVAFELSLDPTRELMEVNAFYASYMNQMSIMIPFIDQPNMDPSFPAYAKYALTGNILGHEMGHSIDPAGIEWNEEGHYEKWMPKEDVKLYEERIRCLRDQYDNYDDPDFGKNLDSSRVINEIVADRHGIDATFHTYRRLNITNDPKMIGFEDVPSERMIYHVMALDYCAPRSVSTLEYTLQHTNHPTNSFRVNGIFSNLKSFAEAFNCPVGSPMNPEKKCELLVEK